MRRARRKKRETIIKKEKYVKPKVSNIGIDECMSCEEKELTKDAFISSVVA